MGNKSKYQTLQDGQWKSPLRTGSPTRRITSDYHMTRVAARRLRKAGDKEGANQLFRSAEAMKLAGHPTVKSQAFVDAEQQARGQGGLGSAAQDAYAEFIRNRNRNRNRPRIDMNEPPTYRGGPSMDDPPMYRGPYMGRYGNGPEEMPAERRPRMDRAFVDARINRTPTR